MDGGVSGSATHLDLLAGAERALALSFFLDAELQQSMLTLVPGGLGRELDWSALERHLGVPLGALEHPWRPDELMDPTLVPEAMDQGKRQAEADGAELHEFWA